MSTWAMLQALGLAITLGCFMEVLNFSEDLFADRASDLYGRCPVICNHVWTDGQCWQQLTMESNERHYVKVGYMST